jgi:hypothetical protein
MVRRPPHHLFGCRTQPLGADFQMMVMMMMPIGQEQRPARLVVALIIFWSVWP